MKRLVNIVILLTIIFTLCACGAKANTTWQEQYDLGTLYLFDGNYEEAIIAFETAIKLESKYANIYISLADAYRGTQNIDQAIENLQTALALDEALVEAYLKLADIYIILGEYEQATTILQQGIE